MNLKLETEFSKAPILQEVDALKKQIDDARPLSPEIEGRVMQKLRLEWNYNSNAIEGNKLTYGETNALLMHGITAKGKPLKDHLDIKGHNQAVEYLERIVKDDRDFTESDVRGLHEVILGESYASPALTAEGLPTSKQIQIGKYKSMPNHVQTITGKIHYYATPEETPARMADLMTWYEATKEENIHAVVVAALFHHRFVAIHPFDDGNGRMARILMNLILMRNGYPPVVVKKDDKENYYSLLSQADSGEDLPFIEYIAKELKTSLNLYLIAIEGGDINEDKDIDKKIALLKIEFQSGSAGTSQTQVEKINGAILNTIVPFIDSLKKKISLLKDLFESISTELVFVLGEIPNEQIISFIVEDVHDDIKDILNSHINTNKLTLIFSFNKLKVGEKDINKRAQIDFSFKIDYYEITSGDGRLEVIQSYNETLTKAVQNEIATEVLNQIKP